jgi:apolipoprotein N-acyltransferase
MTQLRQATHSTQPKLRVAFVQPSIPQTIIWDPVENDKRFAELMRLSAQSVTNQPDLILWPEAAMPGMLRYDEAMATNVLNFARSNNVWMIVGSDDIEPAKNPTKPDDVDDFNASFLINPGGEIVARYCKRNLVMFGEYIPLWRWVSFVELFTPIRGGFAAGDSVVPFELNRELPVRTATLICFEDVFPHHTRKYVKADTDFLINLTNDGWFGEGGEQWQHANAAVFRAVENNIPLLRVCNNGLTCWIDSRGRYRELFRDTKGSIHGAGVMFAEIPLLGNGQARARTFYNRHGDVFGWSCVAITALTLLPRLRRRSLPA